jgi:uncharacterized protein DUF4357
VTSATIKLFLPQGEAKSLRTAEISNWSGKAVAAPRTELQELLLRPELENPGVYILLGTNPSSNAPHAYIGEAEVLRERLKQHRSKEFWTSAIVFVSKDENLTKAHVRYLENRILSEAMAIGRFSLEQNLAGGSKLPESDKEDMEVFLERIRQLLPVLGSDILTRIVEPFATKTEETLVCRIKNAEAKGRRSKDGFTVLKESTAVANMRPSAQPWVHALRDQLLNEGILISTGDLLTFVKDAEFSSPSAAAAVVRGGNSNGLTEWKTVAGVTLKELDERD